MEYILKDVNGKRLDRTHTEGPRNWHLVLKYLTLRTRASAMPLKKPSMAPRLLRDKQKLTKLKALREQIDKRRRMPKMRPVEGVIDLTAEDSKDEPSYPNNHRSEPTSPKIRILSVVAIKETSFTFFHHYMKTVLVGIGYYTSSNVTPDQLNSITSLLQRDEPRDPPRPNSPYPAGRCLNRFRRDRPRPFDGIRRRN